MPLPPSLSGATRRRLVCLFGLILPSLLGVWPSRLGAQSTATEVWQDFAANPHQHQNIPHNAYAGYRGGRMAIPDVPVVVNLLDFGGVGDGLTDNTAAFGRAIEAAWQAGGGAVLIPAGTYVVQEMIHLNQSGVVLRGAGRDQTTLRFPNDLNHAIGTFIDGNGNTHWFWQGGLVWMGPASQLRRDFRLNTNHEGVNLGVDTGTWWPEQPGSLGFTGKRVASVTGTHEEGSFTVTVDDAASLVEGQYYRLAYKNDAASGDYDLNREMVGHPLMQNAFPWAGANAMNGRPQWLWPVRIAKINGLQVTLEQPLRLRTLPKWEVGFETMGEIIQESGIEHLRIELTSAPNLPANHSHDVKHNALYLTKAINCWVRQVDIVNAQNGILTRSTKNIELRDFRLLGDVRLHHGVSIVRGHDNLITDFVFEPIISHGLSIEDMASGNVFRRGLMGFGTASGGGSFDSHRFMSFDVLRTDIYVLNSIGRPGGNTNTGPLQGRRVVHWNIRGNTGTNQGEYVNMPDAHSYGALVGVQGVRSNAAAWGMIPGDKGNIIADEGIVPAITDLFTQQVELRQATEAWIELKSPHLDLVAPGLVHLTAAANPGSGVLEAITFAANGSVLGTVTEAPFTLPWTAPAGVHDVVLTMVTSAGTLTSPTRRLIVGERERIEDTDARFAYDGNRTRVDSETSSDGTYTMMRGDQGASTTLRFRGTRFQIFVNNVHATQQRMDIFINDLNNPVTQVTVVRLTEPRFLVYDSGPLPEGDYRVKIKPPNAQVMLDYVVIEKTGTYSGEGELPDPPIAPANLAAAAVSSSTVDLTWSDLSDNESGFQIERSLTGTGGWLAVGSTGPNATSSRQSALSPSTLYFFRVRAFDANGPSPYSNVASVTTPVAESGEPPLAPINLAATATSAIAIELTWSDPAPDETGFAVERAVGGSETWSQVALLPPNTTYYRDSGLLALTAYSYRVRAFNAAGSSPPTPVATATTLAPGPALALALDDTFADLDRTVNPPWLTVGGGAGGIVLTQEDATLAIGRSSSGGHVYLATSFAPTTLAEVGATLTLAFRARMATAQTSNRNYEFGFGLGYDQGTTATADNQSVYADDRGYVAGLSWAGGLTEILRDAGTSNFLGRLIDSNDQTLLGSGSTGLSLSADFQDYTLVLERTEQGLLVALSNGDLTLTRLDTAPPTTTFNTISIGYYNRSSADALVLDRVTVTFFSPADEPDDLYATWLAAYPELPADQLGALANPSGDGLPNLLKFALGLDPRTPSPDGRPLLGTQAQGEDTHLSLRYRRHRDGTEVAAHLYVVGSLVYQLEASTDLITWRSLDDLGASLFETVGSPTVDPDHAGFEQATFRLRAPWSASPPSTFLRLTVRTLE